MPEGSVPLLIAIVALIILSAFFSSVETAYSCSNKVKLRTMCSTGNKRAGKVLTLAEEDYDKLISTILVGNNIVNLSAATLSTLFFALIITNGVDSSLISTIAITVAVLIFGEITPKFIAKSYPEKLSMVAYPIIKFFYYIFYPINFIFSGYKWLISKVFKLKNNDVVTEEEILTIVEEAEEDGTLREEETDLIRSVIEFDDVEVGDILVPRVNMVAIDEKASKDEIRKIFKKEGYSRLPVYKDSIDKIIGTLHEKDFYSVLTNKTFDLDKLLQPAFYTTEHIKISVLLKQLQKKRIHMAIVLDEYGGTLGLVTLEDIIEELIGEIWDEFDEEVNYFKESGENCFVVDGNAPLADVFEKFELEGEEENFEAFTLSGWIIETLGEIPRANKSFEYKNLEILVLKSTVKKVLQVKISAKQTEEETEEKD